jgi:hypothetical protein
MRIAITGASGFCGSAAARAAAGADVVCLGRQPGPVGAHRYGDATRDHPTDRQRTAYGRSKAAGKGSRWRRRSCCGRGRSTGRATRI